MPGKKAGRQVQQQADRHAEDGQGGRQACSNITRKAGTVVQARGRQSGRHGRSQTDMKEDNQKVRLSDRQVGGHTGKQLVRDRQVGKHTGKQLVRQAGVQENDQSGRQVYRKQPVRKADRQTGRQGRREGRQQGRQKGRQSDRSQTIIQTNRQNAPMPKDIRKIADKHAGRRRKDKREPLQMMITQR